MSPAIAASIPALASSSPPPSYPPSPHSPDKLNNPIRVFTSSPSDSEDSDDEAVEANGQRTLGYDDARLERRSPAKRKPRTSETRLLKSRDEDAASLRQEKLASSRNPTGVGRLTPSGNGSNDSLARLQEFGRNNYGFLLIAASQVRLLLATVQPWNDSFFHLLPCEPKLTLIP